MSGVKAFLAVLAASVAAGTGQADWKDFPKDNPKWFKIEETTETQGLFTGARDYSTVYVIQKGEDKDGIRKNVAKRSVGMIACTPSHLILASSPGREKLVEKGISLEEYLTMKDEDLWADDVFIVRSLLDVRVIKELTADEARELRKR